MRVLFVTTEFPGPPLSGGRVRSLGQLRLLLGLTEITALGLFSLTETPMTGHDLQALHQGLGGGSVLQVFPPVQHPIHVLQHPRFFARLGLRRLFWDRPYVLAKWYSPSVCAALRTVFAARWDVVYIDHLGLAVYRPWVKPCGRLVLDCHNIESEFFHEFAQRLPAPLRFFAAMEARTAARHEAVELAAADATVAISDRDGSGLRSLVHKHTGRYIQPVCVPPVVLPVSVPRPVPRSVEEETGDRPEIVYVGNLSWRPNVAGLHFFLQKVWPRVRARLPAARLTIAGSGLAPGSDGGFSGPGVSVVGYVDDVQTVTRRAHVFVAPVVGGSGVRIKLLDSLRLGVPTVTTTAGALGLPLTDGLQVRIADTPQDFAAAVVDLCVDPRQRAALRQAGFAFLQEHHSLQKAQAAMRLVLGLGQ